jgi:fibronectin type 3 domain-containing protein
MKIKKKKNKKQSPFQLNFKKVIGYHIYRSEDENAPFEDWTRITVQPIKDGNFNDSAETGKRFFYKLTEVDSRGGESEPYTPKTAFTDHAGNKFSQNPLKDFVGYNIYRSAEKNVPLDEWEKRNDAPLPTTEFKDEGVEPGEIYFYYVRAVDSRGTESAPGEVVRVIRK